MTDSPKFSARQKEIQSVIEMLSKVLQQPAPMMQKDLTSKDDRTWFSVNCPPRRYMVCIITTEADDADA